jgi:hypothetical protein
VYWLWARAGEDGEGRWVNASASYGPKEREVRTDERGGGG